jgi:maltokinase
VTALSGAVQDLGDGQRSAIRRALARWRELHAGAGVPDARSEPGHDPVRAAGGDIELVDMELLRPGRPGVLDVVAEMDGRLAHAVFGLRRPGDELQLVGPVDEPALAVVEDGAGIAVMVDALHDAEASRLLLASVAGPDVARHHAAAAARRPAAPVVALLHGDTETTTLGFDRIVTLTVFSWLRRGPHPGVTFLTGLDEAGFNHLAAPMALWRRAGRDLGVVQELLAGAAGGWSLALTSLRDLFASGVPPEAAGGDFAAEAKALGTMAARMHLALDRAFGRRPGDVEDWVEEFEASDPPRDARHDAAVRGVMDALRGAGLHPPTIRTHGDFQLGRTARTDHGWVLSDCMHGGVDPSSDTPVFRSPLTDVADMLWSLHHAATVAAYERNLVAASPRVRELAEAWEARNRGAFVAAYLATAGIGGLVPADRDVVRRLLAMFETASAARHPDPVRAVA